VLSGSVHVHEHRITAELGRLREAREFTDRIAAEFGLNDQARYEVKLAVSEAVANAIQHGSSSPQDPIVICAIAEPGALVLEIVDTGRFVPRVPRRGDLPERGRGLDFMRVLMDEVDVRPGPNGTVLRFVKRRSP
jgi:anti-sigma regulatory factor (Ser/Thr protein kinase)